MGGAAITIGLQQLKGFLGIKRKMFTTKTDIVFVLHSVFSSAKHGWNWHTILIGVRWSLSKKLIVIKKLSLFHSLPSVPLPLIGMVAYSFVAALSLQLATKENLPFGINKSSAQLMLLGSTTSMATAGAYFLYILTTSFSGSSCSYCLLSVLLSFSLFFITLKDIGLQEKFKQLGLQLFIASLVILTLNTSYSSAKSDASRKLPSLKIGSRKFAHLLRTQLMFKINPLQAERK